ncbi:IS1634 family transposase [Lachnospiraceae bacterium ZAX-1]
MYLKQSRYKSGRTFLSIVHGFWDPDTKQSRTRTVTKLGYIDELEKEYADPLAHFREVAKQMTDERNTNKNITLTLDSLELLERGAANRKNYGHVVFSKIYHELEIDRFLKNARRHENFKFNTDAVMRLLVFTRLLYPGSKRAGVLIKDRFFDTFKFSLDDVYDGLTHFDKIAAGLQQHLHEQASSKYGRDTQLVYYDATNYYFEVDKQDELRKKGPSKEHRKGPIVQMGLLLDKAGLPISYKLFPGNTHDSQTLMPMLTEVKKNFGVGRIIAVADKGLNSGDNIAYNTILGDGYIYSKSIRGASADFKKWVLGESGYRVNKEHYKLKSKIVPDAEVNVTVEQIGKKKIKEKVKLEQKWVVFYSEKYAVRARYKRQEAIEKAIKMIENPAKYRRTFDYGAAGYIENLKIDKDTGEITNLTETLLLNKEKIADEERYDGYYAVITSELDDSDERIIDSYRGLWRIEESFKVTKSVLGSRPVYLRTQSHINAHFLTCFISLLIARLVELQLGGKYTIAKITETLRNVSCSHIDQNHWLFDYADDVTDDMNAVFGTDFGRKIMTLKEIKKNLGSAKIG